MVGKGNVGHASALRAAVLLLMLTFGSGCYRVQYLEPAQSAAVSEIKRLDYFLAGAVGQEELSVAQVCSDGISAVEVRHGWREVLIGLATLGIYTPIEVEVWCRQTDEGAEVGQ